MTNTRRLWCRITNRCRCYMFIEICLILVRYTCTICVLGFNNSLWWILDIAGVKWNVYDSIAIWKRNVPPYIGLMDRVFCSYREMQWRVFFFTIRRNVRLMFFEWAIEHEMLPLLEYNLVTCMVIYFDRKWRCVGVMALSF